MTFPVLSAGTSAYNLQRSLRFRASATAYLNRTPGSTGSSTTWTWSSWIKRGVLGEGGVFYAGVFASSNDATGFQFRSDNTFQIFQNNGASTVLNKITTQVFRDPSAWYHLVCTFDTTNATAEDRVRLYVNGVRVTSFSSNTNISLNGTTYFNSTSYGNRIFRDYAASYLDGYLTEFNFIDGQALTPSSFGSTNAVTGVWQPARYTGTYGTNGFYLPFTNTTSTSTLGNDFSGNSNNWTTNNISLTAGVTYDSMTDVPTLTSATAANFAVMNPLWQGRTNAPTNGNLDYPASSVGIGTMDVSRFSSYWEITSTGGTTTTSVYSTAAATTVGVTTGLTYGFRFNSSTGALDYTTNGSSFTSLATGLTSGPYFVYVSTAASTTASFNGGQRPFAYTPPSGFVALNTFNLPSSTIPAGNKFMDATLYTGNGSTQSVTGVGFQPDFVWIKDRTSAEWHRLYDAVRGATKELYSNTTNAEGTDANGLSAFNSNGFSVGTLNAVNKNTDAFVAWQWKANGAGVTNTSGSITSTVSANTTSGFSVVKWNGTGNATIGHGLGVAPSMYIVKLLDQTSQWYVYFTTLGAGSYVQLNLTAGVVTDLAIWQNTAPTSTVFYIGSGINANNMIAYCFTPIAGFSAFGSYTGNGSTDGPFIYTGFRPRWVMVKRSDSTSDWTIVDTARNTSNVVNARLFPNLNIAEETASNVLDIVSNGFKFRIASIAVNASGGTYIYAAFAENPFKNALAR